MFPFQPKRSLFANPDENIGLSPDDLFALHVQQMYSPDQQDVNMPTFVPETGMNDRFAESINQMPIREKPKFGRRLLGAIGGLGIDNPEQSLRVTDQIANKPYYEKMGDWELKTKNLKEGAELENRRNVNSRMLVGAESQANKRTADIQRDKDKLEQANTKLEQDKAKSDQIYQTKIADLEEKARQADNKLNLATDIATQKQGNAEAQLAFKKAELDAEKAKWNLDRAQKDRQLGEQTRLHDIMSKKWQEENKDRDARIAQYEKQLGINQQNADTNKDKAVNAKPNDKQAAPKIGDMKTFPNGNKGKWDGKGWVKVE